MASTENEITQEIVRVDERRDEHAETQKLRDLDPEKDVKGGGPRTPTIH
jgi:hypothetical protein